MSPRFHWLLLILSVLPTFPGPDSWFAAAPRPDTKNVVQLHTDYLPTPLLLSGDKAQRSINAVEIRGDIPTQGDGKGTVTFDQSEIVFNEFGDGRIVKPKPGERMSVMFRRLVEAETGRPKGRPRNKTRVYNIEFADGSFAEELRLVLADHIAPHRLLVYKAGRPTELLQILNLTGQPEIKEAWPDAPRRGPIGLTTLSPMRPTPPAGLHTINLNGTPGSDG
jgi:hypothetical protein